jgi:integrase
MNTRNRTSKTLKQPHLKNIRLYDFRHYFATMLYARTRDILYVKKQMGHKKIDTTLIYTQLIQYEDNDKFTCKVARTEKEMTDLIEHGFDFIHEKDGLAYFRKRK